MLKAGRRLRETLRRARLDAGHPHPSSAPNTLATREAPARRAGDPHQRHPHPHQHKWASVWARPALRPGLSFWCRASCMSLVRPTARELMSPHAGGDGRGPPPRCFGVAGYPHLAAQALSRDKCLCAEDEMGKPGARTRQGDSPPACSGDALPIRRV